MAEREVRYCTSADGTRIAYTVFGDGPALLQCPYTWESFADEGDLGEHYRRLWRGRTTVRYDFRGVGLSQRTAPSYELNRMADDIQAVADAARLERFSIIARALSTPVAIRFATTNPDRVCRLALMGIMTESTDVMSEQALNAMVALVRSNWELGSQVLADLGNRPSHSDVALAVAEVYRRNTNTEAVAPMLMDFYA